MATAQSGPSLIDTDVPAVERPKIAVVLAGGGAKGAAHIGVLKALEELKIPVDYITGTSMGAYVGGLYATGMSADEIESFLYSVNWNSGFVDKVPRSERRVRDKEYEDRYQLTTDFGLGIGELKAAKGVVQGQSMLRILRETTGNLPPFTSFDELAIPYRSVATDIIQLEPVILSSGYLTDAMMASMSVPGALPPYEVDGKMLVDGGVTNNMPVELARALGADIIIAVDISSDYRAEEEFTNLFTVASQLSNYLVQRSTREQTSFLAEGDVLLKPEVGRYGTTDFSIMPEAYVKGYEVAHAAKEQLQALSVSSAEYQHYVEKKQQARAKLTYVDEVVIDRLEVSNNSPFSDEVIAQRLNLESGEQYSTETLEQSIRDLYVLDRFELVTYQFDQQDDDNVLRVNIKEKSWGPNFVDFRFFLEDDFQTKSQYSIGVSTNFTGLTEQGAELRANVELGTDKLLEFDLYSPILSSQTLFGNAIVSYKEQTRNLPFDADGEFEFITDPTLETTENYLPVNYAQWIGELAIGYQSNLWSQFKVGGRYTHGEVEASTFSLFGTGRYERLGLFANYRIDTLDNFALPNKGVYVDLGFLVSDDSSQDSLSDIDDTVYETTVRWIGAHSFGRHTLVGNFDGALVESKKSQLLVDPKQLGGFLNLSGIPKNSLVGQNKLYGNATYRYRWFDNDFGLFSSPFYVGASLEYGGVWSDPDTEISKAPMYQAASVFAGIDSPVGPVMFGYGRTEQNYDSFYLIIGSSFK
ncbi:patatin-like phospholipase family protein [Vibrio scophthalmi]|uniref:patatin-like phospholipase family protein n=1 Tax=Vibrio scophthalmi TaxID=45658 RepID=UPI002FF28225